jgi:diaminopimelate decarboxylase
LTEVQHNRQGHLGKPYLNWSNVLQPFSAAGTACEFALPPTAIPDHVVAHLLEQGTDGPVSGYVYDVSVAAQRARELRAALPPWATLLFAMKANGFSPVVEAMLAPGGVDGLEIASAHEAGLAREVLGAGELVAAAGPGKHPALLTALLAAGTDVIHAESALELHRISRAALAAGVVARVALRVNPARVTVTGTLAMGGRGSAFGFTEPDVPAAIALAQHLPAVDLVGFHMHAVSGNRDARSHAAYVAWCLEWSAGTARHHRVDLRWVDVGGGLGVGYDDVAPLDLALLADRLDGIHPPAGVRVVFEPGRWLAADCGWYAAQVVDVKRSYGGTTFVVVRGGIGGFALPGTEDFPLPVAVVPVDAWHEPVPRPEAGDVPVTISGELCTPEDVLARDVRIQRVRAGDLVVVPRAGAYGWEFALHSFLGHPPPTRNALTSPHPSMSPHPRTLEVSP